MNREPVIFRGSRFLFWALGPFLVMFVVVMALLPRRWTGAGGALVIALIATAILLLLRLYDGVRFYWAGRVVAAMVFVAYAAYFIHELLTSPSPWHISRRRSGASAFNAFLGLLVFGLPGLLYAAFGRVTWREERETEELQAGMTTRANSARSCAPLTEMTWTAA